MATLNMAAISQIWRNEETAFFGGFCRLMCDVDSGGSQAGSLWLRVEAQRIFKLATAISASSAELIQKRTTIFISCSPAKR